MGRVHLRGISLAWAVCTAQAGIGLVAAVIAALLSGMSAALAAGYGSLIAIIPTFYFALRVYWRQRGGDPREVVGSFYRGEIGKMALTALMFFFGVVGFAENFLPLLCAYVACLAAYPTVWLVARID
ncbi:ATP synthase subunit I [Panacagrimonas sp.]|uniref:ATP synthase subunit I n=1 Tax=Panacagrimonas sp. TaxID=2480088 RepID=UPI003B51C0DE